jgi:hypothetical protein
VGGAIEVIADVAEDPVGSVESFAETVSHVVTDPGQFIGEVAEFAEPFAGLAGQALGGPIGSALAGAVIDVAQGGSPFDALQSTVGLLGGDFGQAAGALLGGGLGDAAAGFLGGGNLMNAAAGLLGGGDLADIATSCFPELPDFGGGFLPGLGDLGDLAGLPGLGDIGTMAEGLLGGGSLLGGLDDGLAQLVSSGGLGDLAGNAASMLLGEGGPQAILEQTLESLGVPTSLVSTLTEQADALGDFGFGSVNTLLGTAIGAASGAADSGAFASALEAIGVPTEVLTTVAQQLGGAGDGASGGGVFGSVMDGIGEQVQALAGAPGTAAETAGAAPVAGSAAAIGALDGDTVQSVLGTLAQAGGLDQTLDTLDADGLRALITNMVQADAPAADADADVLGGDMVTTVAGMDAAATPVADADAGVPDAAPDGAVQSDLVTAGADPNAGISDPVMDSAMDAAPAPDVTAPAEEFAEPESDFAEQDAASEELPDQALDDIFGDGSAPS